MSDPRSMVITRLIDAPRELVFDAFTDPQHLASWWGPRGFVTTTIELTVGKQWRFTMKGPDATVYPNRITYREVQRPERLIYDHDADTGTADDPERFLTTVTFEARGEQTLLTLHVRFSTERQRTEAEKYGAVEGGRSTIDRFEEHLSSRSSDVPAGTFETFRVLHAPRPLVYTVWTDPKHLVNWFAPAGCTNEILVHELRVGGLLHYRQKRPDGGMSYGASIYRELTPPERLMYVQYFADEFAKPQRHPLVANWPLHLLTTVSLREYGEHTLLRLRWVPHEATAAEVATFEGAMAGMHQGWSGAFDGLTAYLAKQVSSRRE